MVNLFEKCRVSDDLQLVMSKLKNEIQGLNNDIICNSDLEELKEYYYEKYRFNLIELFLDNINKDIKEIKLKEYNPFYSRGRMYESEYYEIDGYKVIFEIFFDGDVGLLYMEPNSSYLKRFKVTNIISPTNNDLGKIVFPLEFKKAELTEKENLLDFVENKFDSEFKYYIEMINNVNSEVEIFNNSLGEAIQKLLEARLKKADDYFKVRERLNIPLTKSDNAPNTKPILLKRVKKNSKQIPFPKQGVKPAEYCISDNDYENIKNIINLACSSMEKTARTFSKLLEEELRDVILSNLNTHYKGTATGETFNRIGKTDIHIPFENKSAYIGECKIWHGEKKFTEAIVQMFGYTTWRDTKTSLIIFNKNAKDFSKILETVQDSLGQNSLCINKTRISNNEWRCRFKRNEESNEVIDVSVVLYDLFI